MRIERKASSLVRMSVAFGLFVGAHAVAASDGKDIRKLSQDFNSPSNDISPWIVDPGSNIESLSTSEHRGLLTIHEAGRGQDVKGVLKDPIRIDEYPLPWEFQLGLLQPDSKAGDAQTNYSIGVNLAVTFSDPSSWPTDRTAVPPDTSFLQLFVVRICNYGVIYRPGSPHLRIAAGNYC